MRKFLVKYVQHWWLSGGICNKQMSVLARSPDDAKRIVEDDLCLGGVYGHVVNGREYPL